MPAPSVRRLAGATLATLALGVALTVGSTLAGPAMAEPSGAPAPSGVDARTSATSGFDNSVVLVGTSDKTMSLNVPVGSYAISAKLTATYIRGTLASVGCRLAAGGGFDEADLTVTSAMRDQAMALQVVDVLTGPGVIRLTCQNKVSTTTTELTFVKITALKVQSASVVPLDVT